MAPPERSPGLTAESTRTRSSRSDGGLSLRDSDTADPELTWRSINAIRVLAMDAVEAAQSGHPGTPMALAPAAYVLWTRFLRHNPADPQWADRDRFVLSCGHASMLLYALLHLTGYDLSLEELKAFRQWGSRPARGEKVSRTRSAWGWPGGSWRSTSTAPATGWWIIGCGPSPATATSWKASPARRRRSPATSASASLPWCTT